MRKSLLILALCSLPIFVWSQKYQETENGIKTSINEKKIDVEVQWFTPNSLRILKTPLGKTVEKKSLSVIAKPNKSGVKIATSDNSKIVMKSPVLTVTLNTENGIITYAKTDGTVLLKENENSKPFTPMKDADRDTYTVYQGFITDKEEGLYGLGQLQNGQMMQRNMSKVLIQGNVEDVSPIFQSTKGYGVFWDNYSATTYTDNENETSFSSEVGDCIDYYFMYGGSADGVIAQVRALTGEVPMMPLWSYGFMQSKERYKSQEETVGVVKKYRELGIPLDCIIQDWQYWGHNYLWNAMDFRNPSFDNPKAMIDSIHGMNARMMISIWSSFGPATKPYRTLDKEGLLFNIETWPQSGVEGWPPNMEYPSGVRVYDCYNPKARDIYWDYLNKGIFQLGMDGWWMDSTEPDHFNWKDSDFDRQTYLGSYRSVRNAYPLMTVGGVYDHQRAETSDKRVIILTRSGFLGQQRYASNVWSGDVQSSWDMFRKQITAGLNFSLTGMSHWNSDLGGFFAGSYNTNGNASATRNPMYQELYVRWLQFGVFCPMMRSHGADTPREFFWYGKAGEPVYDALVDAVKLRYSLLPYIYSTAWEVSHRQSTFMRALYMDFLNDKNTWKIGNEYMFGKAFLVAPVLHAQYTPEQKQNILKENEGWNKTTNNQVNLSLNVDFTQSKEMEVYLPSGNKWYNYWTNEDFDGGQKLKIKTSLDRIPLFVRAGSIIPIGPDVQYTNEKKWDNLIINVYPGADGTFTLYEDEGDNYNYESGAYTEIQMKWNDTKRILTIDARKGEYNGMLTKRNFTIRTADGKEKVITYSGKKINVKI
ncbi:Alpha-xylosidase [uncultured Bacteroides sp.]|uniref:glycoside hydrolase family 31 protein n=1 Tax=Bacteroides cellulolyticus TaxID=2981780 RepID=UPI0008202CBD|nr:TIM-barrel domain-containing protein [Bacteroides cellulolyticus]MCU6771928.1 glycoside hydrolase family 31 protein [Bacteroides cellulolyticus]SCI10884.1 Alpha-xylosidase [uncultured Bacteroides sp.]